MLAYLFVESLFCLSVYLYVILVLFCCLFKLILWCDFRLFVLWACFTCIV